MLKVSKAVQYFRKNLYNFFHYEFNEPNPTDEQVKLLYAYTEYLKQQNYREIFNINDMQKIVTDFGNEVNKPQFFAEGVQAMCSHAEPIIILLQQENTNLKAQLNRQKNKRRDVEAKLINKIKQLEQQLKTTEPIMAKMHLAYIAGTKATQLIERRPLNPELQPYLTIQKTMTFRQWANKVWKYGKAKISMPTVNYKDINLKPIPNDIDIAPGLKQPEPKRAFVGRIVQPADGW